MSGLPFFEDYIFRVFFLECGVLVLLKSRWGLAEPQGLAGIQVVLYEVKRSHFSV